MSKQESAQSTIEDKLNKIFKPSEQQLIDGDCYSWLDDNLNPHTTTVPKTTFLDIQAIITTENTKARIDELNRLPRHSKDRWPTSPEFDNVQLAVHVPARLAALQKEQKR